MTTWWHRQCRSSPRMFPVCHRGRTFARNQSSPTELGQKYLKKDQSNAKVCFKPACRCAYHDSNTDDSGLRVPSLLTEHPVDQTGRKRHDVLWKNLFKQGAKRENGRERSVVMTDLQSTAQFGKCDVVDEGHPEVFRLDCIAISTALSTSEGCNEKRKH